MHRFVVEIGRKPGLSDPEGATTLRALRDLEFAGVESVAFGRSITIELEAESAESAIETVEEMCSRLLANPVIEYYTIEAVS
jgi:phosphoribosylformylglycinamidine synthase